MFAGSNYYQTGTQVFEDLDRLPAPVPKADVRRPATPDHTLESYNPCAGEYYLGAGPDGRINSFYRTYVQTVLQCVQFFGLENCSPNVQTLWENKGASLETEVIVAHAIEPNFSLGACPVMDASLGKIPGNFTYREVFHWAVGTIDAAGPAVQSRLPRKAVHCTSLGHHLERCLPGRSPGMDALPDILQLARGLLRRCARQPTGDREDGARRRSSAGRCLG